MLRLAACTLLLATSPAPADVVWRTDYAQARKESRESNKPLLFYFTRPDCPPCVRMAQSFTDQANKIALDFIPVKVVAPAFPTEAMKVVTVPTVVVAGPDGTVLRRVQDYQDSTQLGTLLASVPRPKQEKGGTARVSCPPVCPCQGPCQCKETGQSCAPGKPCLPMGLVPAQLSKEETVWHGDKPVLASLVQGEELPDLSGKRYLTVFSKDAARGQKIADEITASPLGQKFRVQSKSPDHWHAQGFKLDQDRRFQETGLCLLYQEPPPKPGDLGKRIDAFYEYDGPESLGRKMDSSYNPNQPSQSAGVSPVWILAGGAFLVMALSKRPEEEDAPEPQ